MTLMDVATGGLIGSAASIGGSLLLAASGTVAPDQLVAPLLVNGPLGVVCAFLLYRSREVSREHAKERAEAWSAVTRHNEDEQDRHRELMAKISRQTEALVRIATILERQPPK